MTQTLQTHITQLEAYLEHLKFQSDLTQADVFIHNMSGGLCMIGKIRTKEKCPACGMKFENVNDKLLICKKHFTIPSRYYIELYWNGKQRKIYSDNDGQVLNNYEIANRVLAEIRQKVKKYCFDPLDYVAKNYKILQFDSYALRWLARYQELHRKGEIAKNTFMVRCCYTENLFIPFFKSVDIRDIKTGDVEDFYLSLPDKYDLDTKRNIMALLHCIFSHARRRKEIKNMPDFPEIRVPEHKTIWIDGEAQAKILGNIPYRHRGLFFFMMRQGVRPGEARALRYEDIDRKNRTVTIRRAFSSNELREFTKTRSIRILPLDDDVYSMIAKENAIAGFVFTHDGKPYLNHSLLHTIWKRAAEKAGLGHVTLYEGTRHSFASQAANRGVSPKLIQAFLGHKLPSTTNRYMHLDNKGLRAVLVNEGKILKMRKGKQ